jgi:hypothetical protein
MLPGGVWDKLIVGCPAASRDMRRAVTVRAAVTARTTVDRLLRSGRLDEIFETRRSFVIPCRKQ